MRLTDWSCGTLSYLLFNLVHHIDISWNTLEPSLVQMYEKLIDLGWTYYNKEIHIIKLKKKGGDSREATKGQRLNENVLVGQRRNLETSQPADLGGGTHD